MTMEQNDLSTAYKRTFDRLALYLLAVFLSPMLFGACLALYSVISVRDSWDFGPTALVAAVYSLPFFALAACPVSLYVDYSAKTRGKPRRFKLLIYAVSGGLAGLVGSLILQEIFSILFMTSFGMVGGLVHFGVIELLKKLFKSS